jgi:hypothetical protein
MANMTTAMNFATPDLTTHPPRSPRVRLGGFVVLPRLLDKGRAAIAGTAGEYCYACPLDLRFFSFVGIDPEALKQQLAAGKSDSEILQWIEAKGQHKRSAAEIASWSAWQEQRAPMELESRQHFQEVHAKVAPKREDVATWFDLLDLDDYVSFGGKP